MLAMDYLCANIDTLGSKGRSGMNGAIAAEGSRNRAPSITGIALAVGLRTLGYSGFLLISQSADSTRRYHRIWATRLAHSLRMRFGACLARVH